MPISNEYRIAVCDDRRADLCAIAEMATEILAEMHILHSIEKYESGTALLADIQSGKQFYLFLLDVMMDEMGGMKLAAELRERENKAPVIFVSANLDLARYGYLVNAARYIAKPLDRAELKEALLYCYRGWQAKKEILLHTDKGRRRIPFSDIQFVEAYDRGTRVVLKDETLEVRLKFNEVEAMLSKSNFLLCHRCYIVNLGCVKYIHQYEFVLKSGLAVPIGKPRYTEVKNKFVDYITD